MFALLQTTLFPGRVLDVIDEIKPVRIVVLSSTFQKNHFALRCVGYNDPNIQCGVQHFQTHLLGDITKPNTMIKRKDLERTHYAFTILIAWASHNRVLLKFSEIMPTSTLFFHSKLRTIVPIKRFLFDENAWITLRLAYCTKAIPQFGIGPLAIIATFLGYSFLPTYNAMQHSHLTTSTFQPQHKNIMNGIIGIDLCENNHETINTINPHQNLRDTFDDDNNLTNGNHSTSDDDWKSDDGNNNDDDWKTTTDYSLEDDYNFIKTMSLKSIEDSNEQVSPSPPSIKTCFYCQTGVTYDLHNKQGLTTCIECDDYIARTHSQGNEITHHLKIREEKKRQHEQVKERKVINTSLDKFKFTCKICEISFFEKDKFQSNNESICFDCWYHQKKRCVQCRSLQNLTHGSFLYSDLKCYTCTTKPKCRHCYREVTSMDPNEKICLMCFSNTDWDLCVCCFICVPVQSMRGEYCKNCRSH